jgi:hypothetical protein
MIISENHVCLAARLYDCRRTVITIYGDRCRNTLQPYMELIERRAESNDVMLSVALSIANALPPDHPEVVLVIAAVVELLEPLKDTTRRQGGRAQLGNANGG